MSAPVLYDAVEALREIARAQARLDSRLREIAAALARDDDARPRGGDLRREVAAPSDEPRMPPELATEILGLMRARCARRWRGGQRVAALSQAELARRLRDLLGEGASDCDE